MEQPIPINPGPKSYDFNIEHFKIRLTARLGIVLCVIVISISRIATIAGESIPPAARLSFALSMPFTLSMALVVLLEYFLFKKLGAGIVKYTTFVDILLLLCLMGDWITVVVATTNKVTHTDPVYLQIGAVFGFTAFSWRTLMVTIIVEKWQLKIIPPCVAVIIATVYVIRWTTGSVFYNLLSAGAQLANIVIIIYCEDRVKWKMILANIQKDRWMQVNNFILNSLPENIMVLDMNGDVKFLSDYFQSFIKKCNLPVDDIKGFFKKVQDLVQQYDIGPPSTSNSMQIERLTTTNGFLDAEDQLGHAPRNQILDDLLVSIRCIIKKNEMQEKQFLIYNGKLKIENQKDKSLEVKISFVKHFDNYYLVVILRDTTQRDLIVTLEETNKYKDQLLASVSHELRAPLNGNINLVESAVNSKMIPERVKENLLIPALRSSKFLLHIINDILDMSQIKEKKLRLVFQSENLRETVKSTAQLVELQAKKKGIDLQVELDPQLPKYFCTDHIRVSQIILNLINNAIKFTKEGIVKLRVETTPDPNLIQISVEDSGIGMSQENVQKLFSSYTHIEFEERQAMNPTGVGLGLNIAYNLSLLLGPKGNKGISVTSFPGQGSNFTLLLENKEKSPLQLIESKSQSGDSIEVADESPRLVKSQCFSQLQRNESESASTRALVEKTLSCGSNNSSCSCPKILIVDDNPFNTMAFETILDSMNVRCDSVYSGSACIKTLLSRQNRVCGENCKQYSFIFMDQEMPEMNGTDTVYEIRRLQEDTLLSPGIKIVGCTAHKSKEEVDKFMQAGIDQCIHKPISAIMIKDILKTGGNSPKI